MTAMRTPRRLAGILLVVAIGVIGACSDDDGTTPGAPQPTRTYRMGFSGIPPRNDFDLAVAAIMMWSQRADAAIISMELPWDSLLAGVPPETLVVRDQVGLANYYRSQG
ncbi:MAG TPA: hypothetical protein VF247_12285, partial [Candidatus Krumholzibacteria bacterium]